MKKEDKLKHIEQTQKEITSMCFDQCFNQKKFVVDYECVPNCYQKFLFAANHIQQVITEEGRRLKSDYVIPATGYEERNRFKDTIFPIGGHFRGRTPVDKTRLKRYEAYIYSRPEKSGR